MAAAYQKRAFQRVAYQTEDITGFQRCAFDSNGYQAERCYAPVGFQPCGFQHVGFQTSPCKPRIRKGGRSSFWKNDDDEVILMATVFLQMF